MPGITFAAGTSWPVRPLAEATRPLVWPQPRKSIARPRFPDQFQTRWGGSVASAGFDDYDASVMSIPSFAVGYGFYIGPTLGAGSGYRFAPMTLEWKNFPADTYVQMGGVFGPSLTATALGDGSAEGGYVHLQVQSSRADVGPGVHLGSSIYYMDGGSYPVEFAGVLDSVVAPETGVTWEGEFLMITYVSVRRTSTDAVLKYFTIQPRIISTVLPSLAAATSGTLAHTGRALRVKYSGGLFTLQTPEGWVVS
jgi:hypothetical protein